jgi:hypothetical protein
MRINGFTQIKSFYSWTFDNQDQGIKPQHISLYLFLLNQNNRNNWVEWFKCPYDLAMAGSCISSKKTYYNCLNDLQKWDLIKYKKGVNNWKAPLIKLEVLKDTSTVPQSEPQVLQAAEQAAIPLPTHIYKLITDNLKLITDNKKDFALLLKNFFDKIDNNDKKYKPFTKIENPMIEKEIIGTVKPTHLSPFFLWLEYKRELKDPYKTEIGLKKIVKEFNKHTVECCEWVVNQSISNEWKGLFWDKYNETKTGNTSKVIHDASTF